MSKDAPLQKLRQRIDKIDESLLQLLGKRMGIAKDIGEAKGRIGISAYQPEREEEVITRLIKANENKSLDRDAIRRIFSEVMSCSRALQEPPSVGFLGPEGTFSHLAALRHFGQSIQPSPQKSIPAVFTGIEKGVLDFGVVPSENS
ncbi:MAG: chorismate mutase, partial [Pseudomonadota bacterium]